MKRKPRSFFILSGSAGLLGAAAAATGLIRPELYERDSVSMAAQAVGQDLVTLLVAAPLLLISATMAHKGSVRGRLIWLGALAYFLYTYTVALFGLRFNPLFLVYVAIFSCSLYALILGLKSLDVEELKGQFSPKTPRRTAAGMIIIFSAAFALIWLKGIVPPMLTGGVPDMLLEEAPTLVVQILDLGVLIPLGIATGILLLRDRPWGYALVTILLVKFTALALAIMSMMIFMGRAGVAVSAAGVVFASIALVVVVGLLVVFLRGIAKV
ncbi:hypothetical protein ACFLT7_05890 [candidate division KSB1 bacterium]